MMLIFTLKEGPCIPMQQTVGTTSKLRLYVWHWVLSCEGPMLLASKVLQPRFVQLLIHPWCHCSSGCRNAHAMKTHCSFLPPVALLMPIWLHRILASFHEVCPSSGGREEKRGSAVTAILNSYREVYWKHSSFTRCTVERELIWYQLTGIFSKLLPLPHW